MFEVLVKNCIAQHLSDYKCYHCNYKIPINNFNAVLEHINSESHKELSKIHAWDRNETDKIKIQLTNMSEEHYQLIVENNIIFKHKSYFCNDCGCKTPLGVSSLRGHINGKHHRIYHPVKKENAKNSTDSTTNQQNQTSRPKVSRELKKISNIKSQERTYITFRKKSNLLRCKICNCSIGELDAHLNGDLHKKNIKMQDLFLKTKFFYCKECDTYLSLNEFLIQCHCLLHLHKEQRNLNFDMVEFHFTENQTVNKLISIKCLLCDAILNDEKTLAEHIKTSSHIQKVDVLLLLNRKKFFIPTSETLDVVSLLNPCIFDTSTILIKDFCTICYHPIGVDEHSPFQKIKQLERVTPTEPSQEPNIHMHESTDSKLMLGKEVHFYRCFLCAKHFINLNMLLDHYNKISHRRKLKNFHLLMNDQELKSILITGESKQSMENKMKEKLKQLQPINKERKPRERSKKQFSYQQDILDFGDKYIATCLESGNKTIYNINSEQFRLFQLGLSLIFNSKTQRICIPCAYNFPKNLHLLYDHLRHEVHIQNLCDMERNSKESEQYGDELSYLDLAKSCMQEESDEWIKCFLCNIKIPNLVDDIKIHMKSEEHFKKVICWRKEIEILSATFVEIFKNSWYYADRFYCQTCNLSFNREIAFAKHINGEEHLKKVKLDELEDEINICHVCSTCWYGSSDYSQHYRNLNHIRFLRKRTDMLPKMKNSVINLLNSIDGNVRKLILESNKVRFQQDDVVRELLKSIEETVKPTYPNAVAYPFGSRNSFLGFPTSDVDVFLDCENIYNEIGSKEKSQEYICILKNNFLVFRKDIWKKDSILLQPRVPLIKLVHKFYGLKCDISFLSGLGVEKSNLIRNYVIADQDSQTTRSLILFLKKWFSDCDLYGPQAINAYAISWFAIFYLQIKNILPSVYQMVVLKNESKIVDGWQCGFSENIPVKRTNDTLRDLLKGFFSYYSEFDYKTDVVCPFLGEVIKKHTFVNIDNLPEGMEIYKCRIETEVIEFFRFDSPMCIQDPVDHSQNITKAVSKNQLRFFKYLCAESYKRISNQFSVY